MTPEERRMMMEMERLQQMRAPNAAVAALNTPEALAQQERFRQDRAEAMQPRPQVGPAPGSRPPNPFLSGLSQLGRRALDVLQDPAARARLAAGFQSMTVSPNQQLIQSQLQRAGAIQASRQQAQQANMTAQYLRNAGREDLATIIEQNPTLAPTILQSMFATSKGVVLGEGERIVDPVTGRVLYGAQPEGGLTTKQREEAGKLVKDYVGNAATKDFQKQAGAYTRVVQSAKDPSPAGDLSLIFNYMKVLDPGSVVRESEFATAAGARAELTRAEQSGTVIPAVVAQAMQRVETGLRLLPEQRQDFVTRAGMLYQGAVEQHTPFRNFYAGKVEAVAPGFGLPPIGYTGDIATAQTPTPSPEDAQVLTVPPTNWEGGDAAWLSLSEAERQEYLKDQ